MALNAVVGQAVSRNKAGEKVELWKERDVQDKGSRFTVSLKSRKGDIVRQVTKVPEGANVTSNCISQFDREREENAEKKEDALLSRLANGKDPLWRPDSFFTEMKGEGDLPWKVRPESIGGSIFADANMIQKVVAAYKASKKQKKKDKQNKAHKKHKKDKICTESIPRIKKEKNKKGKKEKKDKKLKKAKKDKKDKKKKADRETLESDEPEVLSQEASEPEPAKPRSDAAACAEARAEELAQKLREAAQAQLALNSIAASPTTESTAGSISSSESSSSEEGKADENESQDEDEVDWGDEVVEESRPKRRR